MKSDGGMLLYLLHRNAPAGSGARRDLAFGFDGTNDYISSPVIGRTGYDMNVSGNVSIGSDGDGSYFWFNGNRDAVAVTGTAASVVQTTGVTMNQTTNFVNVVSFRLKSDVPSSGAMGLYGSSNIISIYLSRNGANNDLIYRIRNGGTFTDVTVASITLDVDHIAHFEYVSATNRMFCYYDGVLQNAGGTVVAAATFGGSQVFYVGDLAVGGGSVKSANTYIYFAYTLLGSMGQAAVTADVALGDTIRQNPSIVAYYIPDNLQFNTQYGLNPSALDQSSRVKTGATTVTANTTVAPNGTTTADTVNISGTATQGCTQSVTSISGSLIASKTFIVKAFVKVAAGTSLFRLECTHTGVATYNSADLTATTTRQEFTFTQAFTSSTSGTGITYGIDNSSGATNPTLQVRNVRLFLVNETLRDESPNIGGFIGWKNPLVMSAWVKPDIDSADSATKQCFFQLPWHFMQLRATSNTIQFRSDTTLASRTAPTQSLGIGFRGKAHMLFVKYRDGTGRLYKAYVNGTLVSGSQTAYSNTIRPATTIYRTNASVGFYTTDYRDGNIRDIRAYTFTGSFTDADALAIYNGGEPTSSGVTKYLHYKPPVGEVGTTTQDQSPNDRDGTLNGGVTRDYI